MDRESMSHLRFDRRLIRRRHWITDADLERELSQLPDVSHKATTGEEEKPGGPEGQDSA